MFHFKEMDQLISPVHLGHVGHSGALMVQKRL